MIARSLGIERRDMPLLAPLPVRRGEGGAGPSSARTDDPVLTPRQRQVVDGLMRGLTNKEIAAELGVGPDAVKRTISRLLIKLNVPSRTALVQVALHTSAARLTRSSGANALSLLDAVPIPTLVTRGAEHVVEYANPVSRAVLRLTDVGMKLRDVVPCEMADVVEAVADAAFRGEAGTGASTIALDPTGAATVWRHAALIARPLRDGAERLAGLIVFLIDAPDGVAPSRVAPVSKSA